MSVDLRIWLHNLIKASTLIGQFVDGLSYGKVPVRALYEPPSTNASPQGIDGVFDAVEADRLVDLVRGLGRATTPRPA